MSSSACSWSFVLFSQIPKQRVQSKYIPKTPNYPRPTTARASAASNDPSANFKKLGGVIYGAALAASMEMPALAVTGNNSEVDLITTLFQGGITAVIYFLVAPPIIMNWMRLRWYKRKFLEMYFQFMCVFLFFPGLMLWAPFLNFRKLPRDPTMKYPWSTPKEDTPLYKSR